jgi:hypothetical protein
MFKISVTERIALQSRIGGSTLREFRRRFASLPAAERDGLIAQVKGL